MIINCAGRELHLERPQVMGVLNLTPDSFSDGGRYQAISAAVSAAENMVESGAAIIDVGGESTRPGAAEVPLQEELKRVIPVIEELARRLPVPISVDTKKPEVMYAAVQAGAGMINDVNALRAPGALDVAAKANVPVCLMHMQGQPDTMQAQPEYHNVVAEVEQFFVARIAACRAAGMPLQHLLLDPGFGFGKTLAHNLHLLRELSHFIALGLPILAGLSRKSMLGEILDRPVDQRLYGSIAAAMIAVQHGANIVRVHDVAATVQALQVLQAVEG